MYNLERFQALRLLQPINVVPGTPKDLTDAAATVHCSWAIPSSWGRVAVKKFGMIMAAAGGAQTTAGILKLQIDIGSGLADVNSGGAAFKLSSVVSHAIYSVVEVDLDPIAAAALTPGTTNRLNAPPAYPTLTAGLHAAAVVDTQGVGAGSQTYYPYLLVSEDPTYT